MFSNHSRYMCLAVQSSDVESVKNILSEMEDKGEEEGYGELERVVDQRNEQSHAPLHLACIYIREHVRESCGKSNIVVVSTRHSLGGLKLKNLCSVKRLRA